MTKIGVDAKENERRKECYEFCGIESIGASRGHGDGRALAPLPSGQDTSLFRLVLFCINADFCHLGIILQRFSRSTK